MAELYQWAPMQGVVTLKPWLIIIVAILAGAQ